MAEGRYSTLNHPSKRRALIVADGASVEDYVAIATRLAGDLDRLQAMRSGMRERLAASPLCDAERFTLALEEHYRSMWSGWCATAAAG